MNILSKEFEAVVIGSGPNGLAAAITMQRAGRQVLLLEAKDSIGGGLRTEELTLPGFKHDICSAIHPLAGASPFFQQLPLKDFGLELIQPTIAAAHPLDDGSAAALHQSFELTAKGLGIDGEKYKRLISPGLKNWETLLPALLGPLQIPKHPLDMARFGLKALQPATWIGRNFKSEKAKALFTGMAAHGIQPLTNFSTAAIGLVLMSVAHKGGWPIPKGGSASIAKALADYFTRIGGKIETGIYVKSMQQLPSAGAYLFDITPRQLLEIAGHRFSSLYQWQLNRYRYGMGVFKIDWALDGAIPFTAPECRQAGTIHLGNTMNEIVLTEALSAKGGYPEKPFVLLAQQSLFDESRAPAGMQVAWAYCHVPHGSVKDRTDAIEKQVERFAPGFRERIIGRHTFNTVQIQEYNPNYIGGDINGGVQDLGQLFTRPALRWSPYRSSAKGIYICSSSTPPGGGVHGMCGYHAARRALKDVFKQDV